MRQKYLAHRNAKPVRPSRIGLYHQADIAREARNTHSQELALGEQWPTYRIIVLTGLLCELLSVWAQRVLTRGFVIL